MAAVEHAGSAQVAGEKLGPREQPRRTGRRPASPTHGRWRGWYHGVVSVRLSGDEAWAVLEAAHTGIFTTLRADGSPVSLPVWFVVLDGAICIGAPASTKKIGRVRRDPRAGFLVESGERWAELQAVHLNATVEVVDDEPTKERIAAALDAKYESFRTASSALPSATRAHYSARDYLRLVPDGHRLLSWDNRRLAFEEQP